MHLASKPQIKDKKRRPKVGVVKTIFLFKNMLASVFCASIKSWEYPKVRWLTLVSSRAGYVSEFWRLLWKRYTESEISFGIINNSCLYAADSDYMATNAYGNKAENFSSLQFQGCQQIRGTSRNLSTIAPSAFNLISSK